jgi:CPA1 family monovalent cation:H+ antiporter
MPFDVGTGWILLFVVATAVAIVARRVRLPYTVGLVAAGLGLGALHLVDTPHLTPAFLFTLVLPGLVFEAAFNLRGPDLWANRLALALLALPGVALAIAVTTLLLPPTLAAVGAPLAAGSAFLFASLISATDPIAVLALFRRLGAPHRLTVLIEAESLLNDATAIAFVVAAVALTTHAKTSLPHLGLQLVVALVGGALIGLAVGAVAGFAIAQIDDPMIELTITIIVAYGSFAIAQQLGLSGILATVAAGLLFGNRVVRQGMKRSTQVGVDIFWEYVAFAFNSIVFLLIGLEVHISALAAVWRPILAAFVVVVVARALTIAAVTLAVRPTSERIAWRWLPVLTWGGLRGALSMVLVLGLPATLPERPLLIALTFGVVILSIVGQGLSIPALLHRSRI